MKVYNRLNPVSHLNFDVALNTNTKWLLAGSLASWLTLLAPPLTLLAWIFEFSVGYAWLAAALASPIAFVHVMRVLRGRNEAARWFWVQALGLGTLLLPLILVGLLLSLYLPTQNIAWLILLAWIALILLAIRLAHNISEHQFSLDAPQLEQSMRMVQISDVHIGSRTRAFLSRVVTQVLTHNPQIVVITGDLLDTHAVTAEDLAPLALLNCPCYMCLGNHERYVDLDVAIQAIESVGVIVLRDAAITHGKLHLIGIDDRDHPATLPSILGNLIRDAAHFQVLLYHRPDGWLAACEKKIDLTLAGHTHGGQIWPFGLLVKRQYPHMVGRFSKPGADLYVSPGTGTWGPTLRLGTRCEMTVIDLVN